MSTLQDEFDAMLAEQAQLKAKFQAKAQELFKGVTKEFFAKNPGITAIRWSQYTPYFNDGEPCVFHVYDAYFTNCPIDELHDLSRWGDYEGEREDVFSVSGMAWVLSDKHNHFKQEKAAIKSLVESNQLDITSVDKFAALIESSEMEDIMLAMFGDHVIITATREGFDVEECDHD